MKNDNPTETQSGTEETPIDQIKRMEMAVNPAIVPGLIFEQCAQMRALLQVMLDLQIQTVAHLTGQDFGDLDNRARAALSTYRKRIVDEAQFSAQNQPPGY